MKKTLLLLLCAACSKSEKAAAPPAPAEKAPGTAPAEKAPEPRPVTGPLTAEITTDHGTITCKLLPEAAPKTVESFVQLARGERAFEDPKTGDMVKRPFFDGLLFHRVIPEFMIQGGDPLSIDPDHPRIGTGGPGYDLPDEISPDHKFDKPGVLAMANAGPGTGGSQFFITEVPVPRLNGGYTIFGQCENVDVVKKIARVPTGPNDKPRQPVKMQVKILEK